MLTLISIFPTKFQIDCFNNCFWKLVVFVHRNLDYSILQVILTNVPYVANNQSLFFIEFGFDYHKDNDALAREINSPEIKF
mgnify:CR=1 FL=1